MKIGWKCLIVRPLVKDSIQEHWWHSRNSHQSCSSNLKFHIEISSPEHPHHRCIQIHGPFLTRIKKIETIHPDKIWKQHWKTCTKSQKWIIIHFMIYGYWYFFLLCYATLGIYLCYESFLILMILTRSKKPPNARQNTKGPARSVSSMILESVCCSGLRTDNVCKKCINNHKN